LQRAFPLAENNTRQVLREPLRRIILTTTGKEIKPGTPWFRWTLICENSQDLLTMISVGKEMKEEGSL
jgi:hypothetical protein